MPEIKSEKQAQSQSPYKKQRQIINFTKELNEHDLLNKNFKTQ